MSSRKTLLLLVALLIACGTIVLARGALAPEKSATEEVKQEAPAGPEILVAARDLQPGTLLKDSDMKWQIWTGPAKDTMLIKGQADKADYIGALSRAGLRTGEPIIVNKIFKSSEQGFLSAALLPGMRAISVKVTPVSGLAGLIFPGDHVDVIVAHNVSLMQDDKQSHDRRVSETVIVNARVLALDQKTDEKTTDPKIADVATIEVTPKDAEKIALVSDWGGTLSLVLRGLGDDSAASVVAPDASGETAQQPTGYTWDSDVSRVLRKPSFHTGPSYRVQIIRGKDATEMMFDR